MKRREHNGIVYVQFTADEIWGNWRMSDALNRYKTPITFVQPLQEYLDDRKVHFYIDGINKLPSFRFETKDEADEFLEKFNPKGGG